ncbi:MAG: hypothetical protein ABIH23_26070 [bacterium]
MTSANHNKPNRTGLQRVCSGPFLLAVGFIGVLLLRLFYCFQVPWHTTDLLRNLGYGREFWRLGFAVYNYTPQDFAPHPCQFLWGGHYYTYPAFAVFFFALIAPLSPGLIAAKLWLTLFDVVNTVLIKKTTNDRLLAFLYFVNPIGIWHVSHEGQFESVVSFWMILAIFLLRRGSPWSFCALGAAIQTKLFPVFLIPTFFLTVSRTAFKDWGRSIGFFALSFLPSLMVITQSEYLSRFFNPGYVPTLNHISWEIMDYSHFQYQPWWLIIINAVASTGILILIVWLCYKDKAILNYLPSFLFIFFLKSSPLAQFWYLQLFPAFALTVKHPGHRRLLFLACMALGTRSILSILGVQFAYMNPPDIVELLRSCLWSIP